MKKLCLLMTVVLLVSMTCSSALACTALYVGANLTENGATCFGRSEDIANSRNKVMFVYPAGNHKAGEQYTGCYGFTYTFTKDSYAYMGLRDDNLIVSCPNCGGEHDHTPYEAAGTNEMGLTITATETLHGSSAVAEADPMNRQTGIEEAEIVTVVLSEAATAREGVELLAKIYDEVGCQSGSGIFIADNTETWYMENVTGHQYIAVKLTAGMTFAVPNQSVIGLIDLDDKDNVIASEKLIAVAQDAGCFVGDAQANTINYVASYNADQVAGARMLDALNYLNADYGYSTENLPAFEDYAISNVDAEGNTVPMYTNIKPNRLLSTADVIDYWKIPSIGHSSNLDVHVFEIFADDAATDTVEWIAMDNGCYSLFIPYYPMLTTDVADCYKLGTECADFVQEEPAEGLYYATTSRVRNEAGERVTVDGFRVFPDNWAGSMYWAFDVLSNLCDSGKYTDEQVMSVKAMLADEQSQIYAEFAEAQKAILEAADAAQAAELSTQISMKLANDACGLAVSLINNLVAE